MFTKYGKPVKNGLNVVHYTLELNQNYVGLRYDTIFSGVPTKNIKFYQDDVKKKIDQFEGTLLIKYFPTKNCNSSNPRKTSESNRNTRYKT